MSSWILLLPSYQIYPVRENMVTPMNKWSVNLKVGKFEPRLCSFEFLWVKSRLVCDFKLSYSGADTGKKWISSKFPGFPILSNIYPNFDNVSPIFH